jgi:hypothetical protein
MKKAHGTNRIVEEQTHFSTSKHNLVFFFRPNRILTVELHRSFLYSLFFQEKTLGDISFKLETKIAFPNEFTVRLYEYCAGKHWILYWIQENKTATYFLRSRLFTYDNMKNFNCN